MSTIERLLSQAHLFDDPRAYEAGVRDAVEALARPEDASTPPTERQARAPGAAVA